MVYSQRPMALTVNSPYQRSLSPRVIGLSCHLFLADPAHLEHGRQLVVAFLVDVGADGDLLADDALDGKRPPSTCGSTASMITRG
jgi:hypothetical protein